MENNEIKKVELTFFPVSSGELPEENRVVLLSCYEHGNRYTCMGEHTGSHFIYDDGYECDVATHWAYLPKF